MEILQTIWNALITENELLIKLSSIPMTILEVTMTTLLFITILNIESNKKQRTLYILIFSFIAIISVLFIPTPFNTFINILACPILVYFIFKTNILKAILAEIIPLSLLRVLLNHLLLFFLIF